MLVYCDAVSSMHMSSNLVQHRRTKNIEIDIHFGHEKVSLNEVRVMHVHYALQFADVMTKSLPSQLLLYFQSSLYVQEPPAAMAGGVFSRTRNRCVRICIKLTRTPKNGYNTTCLSAYNTLLQLQWQARFAQPRANNDEEAGH
jgi:hypothetical protein